MESRPFTISVATTIFPFYNVSASPSNCDQFNGKIDIDFGTGIRPDQIRVVDQGDAAVGNTSSIANLRPGSYKIFFKNDGECETFYRQIEITQVPMLEVNANALSVIGDDCNRGNGRISGISISGGLPPYTYVWVENASGQSYCTLDLLNLHAGIYRLTVRDVNGCTIATDAISLQNTGEFIAAPLVQPINVCPGMRVQVNVKNQQPGSGVYSLYKGTSTVPEHTNKTGDFTITAEPASSYYLSYRLGECESVHVPVKLNFEGISMRIPSTFSPNGDGVNDVWLIHDLAKYKYISITIFNRNGQKVFSENGSGKPFDGTWKGSVLTIGTYYYVINMKGTCGNLTGSVTILK
ncbi:MAG: gliding motility-associated C-terminal domain-containing protein [Pedobacter sp.]